ncbi:DsbA family protein, partial [Patescibacteria group bacterium AH-259-L07]|nr:DsbA family protein [Patescibacteria group bacterium AH-259-L07]
KNDQNIQKEIKETQERLKSLKRQARGESTRKNIYIVPGAIVIAGLLIAGSIIVSQSGVESNGSSADNAVAQQQPSAPSPSFASGGQADNIKSVSAEDHIRGNPEAPVILVEFSDLECPFCKRFHSTMQQAIGEYSGQVAWVYRHFPLDQLHSKARKEAEATECANELGGNDGFWAYIDRLFEITPSNNRLDLEQLPQIAQDVGLDRDKFEECLNSGKYAQHIESDYSDAVASGGRGTPYSVVIAANGKKFPVSGALPYSSLRSLIESALKEQ